MRLNNFIRNHLDIIFFSIVVLIIFLLGKFCGSSKEQVIANSNSKIIEYRDTIFPKDTVLTFKNKLVHYPVYIDTHSYKLKPIDSLQVVKLFNYRDSIEDVNIKLYTSIITQGKTLISFIPSYKLKIPLIIKDSTVIKKDSLIYKSNKYQFSVGSSFTPKSIIPNISLSVNNNQFSVGYDLINRYPIIDYKYRLFKSKK